MQSTDKNQKLSCPGSLILRTVVNTSFYLSPDGAKQIVVGHRVEEQFPTVIKFLKHSSVENGIDFTVGEFQQLVLNSGEVGQYLRGSEDTRPAIVLSERRTLEFKLLYKSKSVVLTESVPEPGYYARQIVFQEASWLYLLSLFPAILATVDKCTNNEQHLVRVFENICKNLISECQYFDEETVVYMLKTLKPTTFEDGMFSPSDFLIVFNELKQACRKLIVNVILKDKSGFYFHKN